MSSRIWRVAGVDDIHMDGALRWERRWGPGVTEIFCNDKLLLMVGR